MSNIVTTRSLKLSVAIMLEREDDPARAMQKCEVLTEGIVQNTAAILLSVTLIEETFLQGETALTAATSGSAGDAKNRQKVISLQAVMLRKAMLNLFFSLKDLNSVDKSMLGSTLLHLKGILTEAAATNPVITEPSLVIIRREYQDALVRCIISLERLDNEFFEAKPL